MALKDLPDHLLLQECRQDNLKAYDVLFNRYSSRLYHFCRKYMTDEAAAEELVMDVLFQLWQKRRELSIEKQLSSYLFKSVRNAVINFLRKKMIATVAIGEMSVVHAVDSRFADYRLSCQELEELYIASLNALSPQRRVVFEMHRQGNKSYAEIAREMNLSVNTIENYMVSALKFLRKRLENTIMVSLFLLFFTSIT